MYQWITVKIECVNTTKVMFSVAKNCHQNRRCGVGGLFRFPAAIISILNPMLSVFSTHEVDDVLEQSGL